MTIERVSGVLVTPDDAATLVDALTVFEKVLGERNSRPSAKLVDLKRRLSRATSDAARKRTVTGVSIEGEQPDSNSEFGYEAIDTIAAAKVLGITSGGVRDLARRGKLPAVQAGGRWLLDARAVARRAEHRA